MFHQCSYVSSTPYINDKAGETREWYNNSILDVAIIANRLFMLLEFECTEAVQEKTKLELRPPTMAVTPYGWSLPENHSTQTQRLWMIITEYKYVIINKKQKKGTHGFMVA